MVPVSLFKIAFFWMKILVFFSSLLFLVILNYHLAAHFEENRRGAVGIKSYEIKKSWCWCMIITMCCSISFLWMNVFFKEWKMSTPPKTRYFNYFAFHQRKRNVFPAKKKLLRHYFLYKKISLELSNQPAETTFKFLPPLIRI